MRHLKQKELKFIQEWVVTPVEEREFKTQTALAEHLGYSTKTISTTISKLKEPDDLDEEGQIRRFKQKLYQDAMKPTATGKDKELYGRSRGIYIDRMEQLIKVVSADEIARSELEAERRVRELRTRMEGRTEGVSEELSLLPKEIREDK